MNSLSNADIKLFLRAEIRVRISLYGNQKTKNSMTLTLDPNCTFDMNYKRRYTDPVKPLEHEYSTNWKETIFDLNKISVFTQLEPCISTLNKLLNRRISKILYRSTCYAPITKFQKTFVKTLTFSKVQTCRLAEVQTQPLLDMILLD